MNRPSVSEVIVLFSAASALLIAGCTPASGSPEPDISPAAKSANVTSRPESAEPATTEIPRPASTEVSRPAATEPPSQASDSTTQADTVSPVLFEGIAQGRTHDGFYFLGESDADVTLTDYSDFL